MFWDWWAGGGGWAGLAWLGGWAGGLAGFGGGQGRAGQGKTRYAGGQGRAGQRRDKVRSAVAKSTQSLAGEKRGGAATKLAACKSCSYQYRHRDAEVG